MREKNNLAANLCAYRAEKGMTMAECSESLGIPKSTLQSVMKEGNITLDTLLRISAALGKSLDELVYGDKCIEENEIRTQGTQRRVQFCQLSPAVQHKMCYHLNCIAKLLEGDCGKDNT